MEPKPTRRRFVIAAACALSAPAIARGQTLIENSPPSGEGWLASSRQADAAGSLRRVEHPGSAHVQPAPAAAPRDWRDLLLQGDRSILLRRDGPARRFRYRTADGLVDPEGYAGVCYALRDVRANAMVAMDPVLLDVLCGIQRWMEYNARPAVIEITSGFRTLGTNARTEGAVRNSMHLYGRAADVIVEGASSAVVGAMVRQFNTNGGTGIYLGRGFVHVDTGTARSWVTTSTAAKRARR